MGTPVQWLTRQELRDELERTRPAWEALDLDGVPAHGHLPVLSQDTHSVIRWSRTSCFADPALTTHLRY
jgi:hypothetical protein